MEYDLGITVYARQSGAGEEEKRNSQPAAVRSRLGEALAWGTPKRRRPNWLPRDVLQ